MFCFQCQAPLTKEYFNEIKTDELFCGTCHDQQVREMKNLSLADEVECEKNDCGFEYYYFDGTMFVMGENDKGLTKGKI